MTNNFCILDDPAISGKYLFPQDRIVDDPFIVSVDDVELACCQRIIDSDAFTMIHFHSNGEAVADYLPYLADWFAEMRLNSLFVEYREYGGSTGKAQLVAMLGDGEAAMKAAGISPEKTIVSYFNHEQKLSSYMNPLLILHTENDGLIDISHAERNHEWAGSTQKLSCLPLLLESA